MYISTNAKAIKYLHFLTTVIPNLRKNVKNIIESYVQKYIYKDILSYITFSQTNPKSENFSVNA